MRLKSNEELKKLVKDGKIVIDEDLVCDFNIDIEADLVIKGNLIARNIDVWNLDVWNIDAGDIDARNIDARNIDARNIDAWDIVCEKRIKKNKSHRTIARVFITERFKLERKEQMKEE